MRTDVYYLMLTTENQCGTLVFHKGEFEHYWNLSNQLLFTSAKTGLYTLTYSTFQSHITSGRTVTRAQAPTVRYAFHPWKMGFFIFFFKSALEYISHCVSGANLVSREFASESSDLIRLRQFPVSLRCSLADYYFSWWMYFGVTHAHRASCMIFPSKLPVL